VCGFLRLIIPLLLYLFLKTTIPNFPSYITLSAILSISGCRFKQSKESGMISEMLEIFGLTNIKSSSLSKISMFQIYESIEQKTLVFLLHLFISYFCLNHSMKVYLIKQEDSNLYKIGITRKSGKERLKELQIGNGNTLQLLYEFNTHHNFQLETALHAHFRIKKVNSEWFELTEDDEKEFLITCKKYEDIYTMLKKSGNPFVWLLCSDSNCFNLVISV
jgi:hypothetical protein